MGQQSSHFCDASQCDPQCDPKCDPRTAVYMSPAVWSSQETREDPAKYAKPRSQAQFVGHNTHYDQNEQNEMLLVSADILPPSQPLTKRRFDDERDYLIRSEDGTWWRHHSLKGDMRDGAKPFYTKATHLQ